MGFGGCRSGLNGPLLFCLNFAAIDRIHDAFAPDEHADGSTVTEQRPDVITNLSVLGIQVLSRRNRRSSTAKVLTIKHVARKPA